MNRYLFKSTRLGFRVWHNKDIDMLYSLTNDPEVMRYFPSVLNMEATKDLLDRLKQQYEDNRYTYFAVETLQTKQFLGFIGLAWQDFDSPWTPFTDIGWRLRKEFWEKGYATEGALRCLEYGFEEIGLTNIYSVASKINLPSIHVMEKIGMVKIGEFKHPKLIESPELMDCVVYNIRR